MSRSTKQHEKALVVAFDTTASALAFASAAKEAGLSGRLCPIPRTLSAGCGMAWRDEASRQGDAASIVAEQEIDDARIVIMELR